MGVEKRQILNNLSNDEKRYLISLGDEKELKRGDIFIKEGEAANVFFIIKGHAAVYKNSRYDEERTVFICGQDEIVDETAIEGVSTISAKAMDDVTVLEIPRDKFKATLIASPELSDQLFYSLAIKARRLYHQVGNANGTYPLEEHVKIKIWKLARDYGVDYKGGRQIQFEITVTMLATMLGAKRESVSRAISSLKKQKLIKMENGIITVPNMKKLK